MALDRYDTLALNYEASTTRIRAVRAQAIELLGLQPGEAVFDVACGAGAILPALSWRVGPTGRVIGIEQSTAMAAQARSAALTLDNAAVLCDAVETFVAGRSADALILCYTHDVLQSPCALDNLLRQARPGARIVLAGLCLAPWWAAPANAWVLWGGKALPDHLARLAAALGLAGRAMRGSASGLTMPWRYGLRGARHGSLIGAV